MSYNPLNDFKEVSASDRPERRVPCGRCRSGITLLSGTPGVCFACWAGHPLVTKPVMHLHLHPHYIATMARLQKKIDLKSIAIGGSA